MRQRHSPDRLRVIQTNGKRVAIVAKDPESFHDQLESALASFRGVQPQPSEFPNWIRRLPSLLMAQTALKYQMTQHHLTTTQTTSTKNDNPIGHPKINPQRGGLIYNFLFY
ncbi:MAG: hypothetical protein CM1200mP15_20640 [Dehalococcoidia bacterium]|nr:MAG: hypothetical protein CM1200mP15_20640 [Dehalococcoidia bacterium]